MYYYNAFGLKIASDTELESLELQGAQNAADVTIRRVEGALPSVEAPLIIQEDLRVSETKLWLDVPDLLQMYIESGSSILYRCVENPGEGIPEAFLLGTGMGAVLHQRGILPLHGSCVCRDGRAVVIMGDSGAGKSTMAAEFSAQGWRFMSDDIVPIILTEDAAFAQSGYPAQKLCTDALARHAGLEETAVPLRREDGREKFRVKVGASFHGESCPISHVLYLGQPGEDARVAPVPNGRAVDLALCIQLLLDNCYREWACVGAAQKQRLFGQCAALAQRVSLIGVQREKNQTIEEVYRLVCEVL